MLVSAHIIIPAKLLLRFIKDLENILIAIDHHLNKQEPCHRSVTLRNIAFDPHAAGLFPSGHDILRLHEVRDIFKAHGSLIKFDP